MERLGGTIMLTFIKMIPVFIIILSAAYAAHWFIVKQKDAQLGKLTTQVETLTAHNQAMSFAAEENESTINSLVEKNRQQQLAFHDLTEKNNKLAAQRDQYMSIFKQHNLTKLARAKPGLIETRANKATELVFSTLEKNSRELYGVE